MAALLAFCRVSKDGKVLPEGILCTTYFSLVQSQLCWLKLPLWAFKLSQLKCKECSSVPQTSSMGRCDQVGSYSIWMYKRTSDHVLAYDNWMVPLTLILEEKKKCNTLLSDSGSKKEEKAHNSLQEGEYAGSIPLHQCVNVWFNCCFAADIAFAAQNTWNKVETEHFSRAEWNFPSTASISSPSTRDPFVVANLSLRWWPHTSPRATHTWRPPPSPTEFLLFEVGIKAAPSTPQWGEGWGRKPSAALQANTVPLLMSHLGFVTTVFPFPSPYQLCTGLGGRSQSGIISQQVVEMKNK